MPDGKSETTPERVPAEVLHPSVFIGAELEARGWDRWTLAHKMGGDPAINRLTIDVYFAVGPIKTNCRLGKTAEALARAFDVSPEFFRNLEAVWLKGKSDAE